MNILKTLRKPYFGIFLATLMLFVSCNKDDLLEDSEIQMQTLDEYIAKHIELTSKFVELKNSINYDIIEKLTYLEKKSSKTSNLKLTVQKENITIPDDIIEIELKIIENTKTLYNNPNYNSLNQQELLALVTNEINNQFVNAQLFSRNGDRCLDAFNRENESCLRSFGASLATVGVVGLFTSFGVGSLIGGGIALLQFGECNKDAQAILANCRGGGNEDDDPRAPIPF